MKQKLFKYIFILCSAVLFSNSLVAQLIARSGKTVNTPAANYADAVMNPKVQTALTKNFKEAVAITWHNVDNNIMVRFTEGKIIHRILFSPNGKQIYHISYTEAVDLLLSIVRKVKNHDGSLMIQRGIKVEQANITVWIIYAENENQLLAVRIEDGEVQLFEVNR